MTKRVSLKVHKVTGTENAAIVLMHQLDAPEITEGRFGELTAAGEPQTSGGGKFQIKVTDPESIPMFTPGKILTVTFDLD